MAQNSGNAKRTVLVSVGSLCCRITRQRFQMVRGFGGEGQRQELGDRDDLALDLNLFL